MGRTSWMGLLGGFGGKLMAWIGGWDRGGREWLGSVGGICGTVWAGVWVW
jgi:hypothetical protein